MSLEAEVRKCVVVLCPNWPYRMGTNPLRAAREITEEQREQLVARMARARAASSSQGASPANLTPIFQGSKSDEPTAGAGIASEPADKDLSQDGEDAL